MQRQDERFTETCVVIDKLERHEFGGFLVAKNGANLGDGSEGPWTDQRHVST